MDADSHIIDFEPARVASVVQRSDHVAVIFPGQPCYSKATGENPRLVPIYACEMRVWDGEIVVLTGEFPFATEDWEVEYEEGRRACFLPTGFQASGGIKLPFSVDDVPRLIVVGKSFTLEVMEQVGTDEMWPAT